MGIGKLLVANRGEIAVRIFRTCRELGIATVAVVAPDDAGALHARSADETVAIASYLHSEEHIRAAKQTGADAVHPGYGFLAESGDFAEAVEAAGLVFVGPTPEALRAGGDKLAAKRAARAAGVPVLDDGDPASLGFPLLVKAAAGGGGRGMRVVRSEEGLGEALEAARREAGAAFGDDGVFCERYLERPRHVEIQLLADGRGNAITLGERECSVQRRHQKVLEESPSPAARRRAAGANERGGCRPSRSRSATGAPARPSSCSTGRDFFFLELNGRIQVEHPVTELVSGLDLVAAQLELAEGGELPPAPELRGHAVEVRLYAEDPRTFLPQTGRIERLRLPAGVRVDAGVEEGDEVGLAYDPMIAKLIAHGRHTRGRARPARGRSRRHRGRGRCHQPSVPALAGRPSADPVRRDDDRVPRREPAALRAAPTPAAAVARPVPAQSRFPPAPLASRRGGGRSHARPGCRAEHPHRADARDGDPRARRRRRSRPAAAAARRARGDEDGDAAASRPTRRP